MKGQVSLAAWLEYAQEHPGHVHVVSIASRPGTMSFSGLFERRYFAPKTPTAAMFSCAALHWQGIDWVIVSFPANLLDNARDLAKQLCMRFVAGWPTVQSAGIPLQFPGRGSNVRTLENDLRQPIYDDLRRDQRAIIDREIDVMNFLGAGKVLMPTQVLEYIYRDGVLPGAGAPSESKH